MERKPGSPPSRRQMMATGAAVVAGAGALAGCGGSSSGTATSGSASPTAANAAGTTLAKLSDVAVGSAISAKSADGKPIIIAQPAAGTVVAFTAICTHMGCTVAPATGLQLRCPCHGSTYDAATGTNTGGPAPKPLAAVPVTLQGDAIVSG